MSLPTITEREGADKEYDQAIATLVDAAAGEAAPPYSQPVYDAAEKVAEAFRKAILDNYDAEVERRRQIGLDVDPATAETTFWYADVFDPYRILGEQFQAGQVGREQFARNPGGEWVHFYDLPEATRDALWERDKRKLTFPYGLNPDDDVINTPANTPT